MNFLIIVVLRIGRFCVKISICLLVINILTIFIEQNLNRTLTSIVIFSLNICSILIGFCFQQPIFSQSLHFLCVLLWTLQLHHKPGQHPKEKKLILVTKCFIMSLIDFQAEQGITLLLSHFLTLGYQEHCLSFPRKIALTLQI